TAWRPLFCGAEAEPYTIAIDAIVHALDEHEVNPTDWGKPLLHAYLAEARSSLAHRLVAENCVDRAIQAVSTTTYPALYGGIAGVGWLSAHTDRFFGFSDSSAYEQIDNVLCRLCQRVTSTYDLISGPVGIGVYFLERLPDPL